MFPNKINTKRIYVTEDGEISSDTVKIYVYSRNGKHLQRIFEIETKDIPNIIEALKEIK